MTNFFHLCEKIVEDSCLDKFGYLRSIVENWEFGIIKNEIGGCGGDDKRKKLKEKVMMKDKLEMERPE